MTLSFLIGAKRAAALGAFIGLTSTIAQVSLVCVLWYGCLLVIDGKLDLGELTSFLLLAIYTIASLGGMMALFSAVMSALGVSRRIFEQLDAQPSLRLVGGTTLVGLRGRILISILPSLGDASTLLILLPLVARGRSNCH